MRSLARKGAGYALVTAGTVMLFTPGPGLLTLFGGLALLSEDTEWAARATDWLKRRAGRRTESPESGN